MTVQSLLQHFGTFTWLIAAVAITASALLVKRFVFAGGVMPRLPLPGAGGERLHGQVFVLDAPIANGRGRLEASDSTWSIEGPDLPTGARVRVTGSKRSRLIVEQALTAADLPKAGSFH